jgi:carboxyl-terminal processing protease
MNVRWGALGLAAGLALSSVGWLTRPEPAAVSHPTVYQQARLFEDVLSAIRVHYVDSISETDLYFRATQGIVEHLNDPYSALLMGERYRQFTEQVSGSRGDVGLEIDQRDGRLTVVTPDPGSPAERDGIQPGDELVAIDGLATKGWKIHEAQDALRGPAGTPVTVLIRRSGFKGTAHHQLVRAPVRTPAVAPGILIEDGIGYVALQAITRSSAAELRAVISALRDQGMRSLLLDLRRNPGGLLDEGIDVADFFLDPGQVVASLESRVGARSHTYVADEPQAWPDLPVAALVDEGTASSAELITAALQDHDRAAIVGAPTFGKGMVQSIVPLGRDLAVRLTTARWLAPSGRSLQRPLRRDSTPADTLTYRSAGGRPLSAQRGVVPDLAVAARRPSADEQTFLQVVGGDLSRLRDVVATYAAELQGRDAVRSDSFKVAAKWSDEVVRRLAASGVELSPEARAGARSIAARELGYELARQTFGAPTERLRRLHDDLQIAAALELLRGAATPAAPLERLAATAAGPAAAARAPGGR